MSKQIKANNASTTTTTAAKSNKAKPAIIGTDAGVNAGVTTADASNANMTKRILAQELQAQFTKVYGKTNKAIHALIGTLAANKQADVYHVILAGIGVQHASSLANLNACTSVLTLKGGDTIKATVLNAAGTKVLAVKCYSEDKRWGTLYDATQAVWHNLYARTNTSAFLNTDYAQAVYDYLVKAYKRDKAPSLTSIASAHVKRINS